MKAHYSAFLLLTSLFLLSRAVAGSTASSCENSGECYEKGEQAFSVGELVTAERFFKMAVEKGDKQRAAFAVAASAAEQGEYQTALEWLENSCRAGYSKACDNVAGTKKVLNQVKKTKGGQSKKWIELGEKRMQEGQFPTAKLLFAKACSAGSAVGCTKLGEAEDTLGEKEAAAKHLQQGCDGKDWEGCRLVGVFAYRSGDKSSAKKWFKLACDHKHYESCGFLAGVELKAGNEKGAVKLLETACVHSVLDACESLAFHYAKQKDDKKTKAVLARVKKLLHPQCEAGKSEACRRLASLK